MILNSSSRNVETNAVELLWENNPFGVISNGYKITSTNVTEPHKPFVPNEYNMLYITSYSTSDKKESMSTFPIFPGVSGGQQFAVYNGKYCYHRTVTVNEDGVTFSTGNRLTLGEVTSTANSAYAVPYRIYGVKYRGDDSE